MLEVTGMILFVLIAGREDKMPNSAGVLTNLAPQPLQAFPSAGSQDNQSPRFYGRTYRLIVSAGYAESGGAHSACPLPPC